MPKLFHFHRYYPDPKGNGCHHRIFQNYFDLLESTSETDIGVFPLYLDKQGFPHKVTKSYPRITSKFLSLKQVLISRLNLNPLINSLINEKIRIANPFGYVALEPYKRYIEINGKPKLCFVDHPSFLEITRFNYEHNIITIYLPHNIESFTRYLQGNRTNGDCATDWVTELEILKASQEHLIISLLESTILKGLGFSTQYYPYLPVSKIRERLLEIRQARLNEPPDRKLFLMVGSIFHKPTGNGFRWLLDNIKQEGLPDGLTIVVGGKGGETIASEYNSIPGLKIKGSIDQDEFDSLLKRAAAMLIPQQSGFGSLTRIPEMACAGVPIITTDFATSTLNTPPGVRIVSNDWASWKSALLEISEQPIKSNFDEYQAWQSSQPRPIKAVIEKYL